MTKAFLERCSKPVGELDLKKTQARVTFLFLTFRINPSGLIKDFKGVLNQGRPQLNPNPTIRAFI